MRVVAVGDAHGEPGQDLTKYRALGNYAAEHGIDHVVLIGDFITMQSLSSFEKPGSAGMEGWHIEDEINYGCQALEQINSAGGKFQLHYIEGNHEDRIKKWIEGEARLQGLVSLERAYESLVDSWTPYRHALTLGGVLFTHVPFNQTKAVGGVYPAYRASLLVNKSIVFGHTHKVGVHPFGTFGDVAVNFAINIGCFFEQEYDPDYMDGRIKSYWRGIFDLEVADSTIKSFDMIPLDKLKTEYK